MVWGAALIMLCHLAGCVSMLIFSCIARLGQKSPTADWPALQLFSAAWSLAGIVVIIAALYGTWFKLSSHLRLYFHYFVVSVLLSTTAVYVYVTEGSCSTSRDDVLHMLQEALGHAYMCGVMSVAKWVGLAGTVVVGLYCLSVVWSFLDEVDRGVHGPHLSDLSCLREEGLWKSRKRIETLQADGIMGFAQTSRSRIMGPSPALPYGSVQAGMLEQGTLFGCQDHDASPLQFR